MFVASSMQNAMVLGVMDKVCIVKGLKGLLRGGGGGGGVQGGRILQTL